MKARNIWGILFLVIGVLTVLEFIFIRGMFTWLMMVALVSVVGLVNIVLSLRARRFYAAAHFLLTSVALVMGYFILAF